MNNIHKVLDERILEPDIKIDSNSSVYVIKIERDSGEMECQLWVNKDLRPIVNIRFVKEKWGGYLYRLDKVTYYKNIPEDILSQFFKVVELTIVEEIGKSLIKEANGNIVGFKQYFYAYVIESKEYWFKKYFPGITNETPTLLVYLAS